MAELKRRSAGYYQLRKSLLENLESRGLVEDVYADKVQEYMDLWEYLRELRKNIRENGCMVMDYKRGMEVENRSVTLALQTSRQMLAIYAALGFRDEAISRRNDSPEEDEL